MMRSQSATLVFSDNNIFAFAYDDAADKLYMGSGDTSQLHNGTIWSSDDQGATWTLEETADDGCKDILLITDEKRVLACQGRGAGEAWIWTNKPY